MRIEMTCRCIPAMPQMKKMLKQAYKEMEKQKQLQEWLEQKVSGTMQSNALKQG